MGTTVSERTEPSANAVPTPVVCVPSSLPVDVKNGVKDGTRKALSVVRDAVNALCLTGALAMGSAPAMAVATANTPSLSQETRDSVAKSLEQKGFSQTFAREVDRLSTENRERIARGELPNEAQYVFSVENMNPITDAKGMDTIVTIGSLLPRADEKTLGLPDTLNESTYEATLDELFKTTDRDIWLRNTDKTELTQKQKDRDRERLAEDRTRYTARLAEFKAGPNGATILPTFFALYNEGKKTITYPSRESYRRLLVASLSIASTLSATPEERTKLAPLVMTQVGEYILLTDAKTGTIVKVGIGALKYLVPSEASIRSNASLAKIGNINILYGVSDVALTNIEKANTRIVQNGKLQKENERDSEKLAQKEEKLAQKEEKLAQMKDEVARAKDEVARTKDEVAQMKDISRLSDEIKTLVLAYKDKPDNKGLLTQLKEKIRTLTVIQDNLNNKYQEGMDSGIDKAKQLARMTLSYSRNEIKELQI